MSDTSKDCIVYDDCCFTAVDSDRKHYHVCCRINCCCNKSKVFTINQHLTCHKCCIISRVDMQSRKWCFKNKNSNMTCYTLSRSCQYTSKYGYCFFGRPCHCIGSIFGCLFSFFCGCNDKDMHLVGIQENETRVPRKTRKQLDKINNNTNKNNTNKNNTTNSANKTNKINKTNGTKRKNRSYKTTRSRNDSYYSDSSLY